MSLVNGIVTVMIERARNLGSSSDPYVSVKLGKRLLMSTHTIGNTQHPVWEHTGKFYFEGKIAKGTALSVVVYDSDGLFSTYLGECAVKIDDLLDGQIDTPDDNKSGAPLVKKGSDGSVTQTEGMIWFKMTYEKAKDVLVREVPAGVPYYNIENFKNDPKQGICKFNFIGAYNLPKADVIGRADPYATVAIVHDELKLVSYLCQTKVVSNTLHVRWEEIIDVFVSGIFLDDTQLEFRVYDKDMGKPDDFIGFYRIPLYSLFHKKKLDGKVKLTMTPEFKGLADAKNLPTFEFECEFSECDEAPPNVIHKDVGDMQTMKWKKEGHVPV